MTGTALGHITDLNGDVNTYTQFFIHKGLKAYETILKDTRGKYSVGDDVTLADVCLIPQLYGADRYKVTLDAYPNIAEIRKNLEELPEFIDAHPNK